MKTKTKLTTPLRFTVAVCAVLLLCGAAFAGAVAAADTWDGTTKTAPTSGDGSQGNPYQIATGANLAFVADEVNKGTAAYVGKYYIVTDDINLNSKAWTPIGTLSKPFSGTFNGQNHTISNLYVSSTSNNAGLFGRIGDLSHNCIIKYVGLENVNVTGAESVGGLVGFAYGVDKFTNIIGCFGEGNVSGTMGVGGLVGTVTGQNTNIENCYAACNVKGTDQHVGGLVGYAASSQITNCYAAGTVVGKSNTGGLVGSGTGTITNSIALNKMVSGSTGTGRVVGTGDAPTNCYAWDGMKVTRTSVGKDGTNATSAQLWDNQTFYSSVGFTTTNWTMATAVKYKLPILKGTKPPEFNALYLAENNILVNFADTTNTTGIFYDKINKHYYAYNGTNIKVPLYLNGDKSHALLGGYDVLVNATNTAGTQITGFTSDNVANLLTGWTGNTTANNNNVSLAYSGGTPINLSTPTSFIAVSLSDVTKSGSGDHYTIYVQPDTVVAGKGTDSMFSGLVTDYKNMSIESFDKGLFNAANNKFRVDSIYIKELATLSKFILDTYGGTYPITDSTPITILWERENATNSSVIANFDNNIEGAPSIVWTFTNLTNNVTTNGTNIIAGNNITSFLVTKGKAPVNNSKFSGKMNITFKQDGLDVSGEKDIIIRNWLINQSWGNNFTEVGQSLSWVLNVSAAPVNTAENATKGWNTYASFTELKNSSYVGIEVTPISVKYYENGSSSELDKAKFSVRNANGNESIMLGSDIYVKNNTIKNPDTVIKISFNSYQLGDATMNEVISIADSSAMGVDILRNGALFNNTVNKFFADVTGNDGKITAPDVQNVNKYLVTTTS